MAFKIPKIFAAGTKAKADDVNDNFAAIEQEINDALAPGLFEAGDLKATARTNPPTGWLLCDGAAVSRITYSDLFAAIGTTYGAGDGATTFNLPDMRGRMPMGPDGAAGRISANDTLGKAGGQEALRKHKHSNFFNTGGQGGGAHTHTVPMFQQTRHEGSGFAYNVWSPGGSTAVTGATDAAHVHLVNGDTSSTGSGGEDGIQLPPYQVVNFLVKI